ncbi:DEKNAAC102537 [Brettanomyces naardenensis]|uniref:DEKNAAC102537 n=1 Tax=Brettanomyces naardenensis TaxID=13370 RepID=A0A448YL32_BRENA|nr:DEKNAAC102537 [Brettanomyces naardenensis]
MTIAGLWEKLVEHDAGGERVPLRVYAESFYGNHHRPVRVGIDAFMWLFELMPPGTRSFTSMTPEMISKLLLNFHSRIRGLISLNVSFVLVFDGVYKVQKRRWETSSHVVDQYSNFDETYRLTNEAIRMDSLDGSADVAPVSKVKQMLKDWNITWVQAPAEAEAELGRLNSCGIIDAVISNDADGFMFGSQVILRNFSRWENDAPSGWTPPESTIKQQPEFYVTPFRMSRIEEKTGLTKERIIFIACLSGNDFSEGASGLGIARAFSLAQIGSDVEERGTRVDFSTELAKNFVSSSEEDYIMGRFPYALAERKIKISFLSVLLEEEIKGRSREYLGRAYHSTSIPLPPDFFFMMHYYPLLAGYVYRFNLYDTNNADLEDRDDFHSCVLPQPAAICGSKEARNSGYPISFQRATSSRELGRSVVEKTGEVATPFQLDKGLTPICWFQLPNFRKMCSYHFPTTRPTRDFLLKYLSEAYVFRAVENLGEFRKTDEDICINSFKTLQLPVKRKEDAEYEGKWETQVYQVRYYPELIFSVYLAPEDEDDIYDENYNLKSSTKKKNTYAWIQRYLLESIEGGRKLISEYETKQKEKQKMYQKGSPKKKGKKVSQQSSTLDNLKISPIKISPKKEAHVLNGKPVPAPKFSSSRPSSKDSSRTKEDDSSGKFWLEELDHPKKRSISVRSPNVNDSERNKKQVDMMQWFDPDRRKGGPRKQSGIPRIKSLGASFEERYTKLVPEEPTIGFYEKDEEPEIIDLSSGSDDENASRQLEFRVSDEEDKRVLSADGPVIVLSSQAVTAKKHTAERNDDDRADTSLILLEEGDSAIGHMEDEIDNLLGMRKE